MSFFKNISRLLGFGSDTDAEEYEQAEAEEENLPTAADPQLQQVEAPTISPEQTHAIFEHAVSIFNEALPDFIAKSVDPEKQKKLIFDSLDQSLKEYLESVNASAHAACEAAWLAERDKMKKEADDLRQKAQELEEKKTEIHERQLSADRQKRALSERVRDLEAQVMKLEAEREQLELENKCMVNKAKAAAVIESELEELRQNSGEQPACAPAGNSLADEAAELRRQLDEANEKIENLEKANAALEAERTKLSDTVETALVKDEMSRNMEADYQRIAAQATQQAKDSQQKIDDLTAQAIVTQAQISDLSALATEKDALIQTLREEIAAKESQLNDSVSEEELKNVMEQVNLFEEVRAKMDSHIARLKDNLKASQAENESLRNTIKNNLIQHSKEIGQLQIEIERLHGIDPATASPAADNGDTSAETRPSANAKKKKKKAEPESASADIDDIILGADWLVSTPPKTASMRPAEDNDSFGYQPPQKKSKPIHNDAQLSLFD